MGNIKIAYTARGPIVGDFIPVTQDAETTGYNVHNPVNVALQPNNVALVPLLGFAEETKVFLPLSEILFGGELFTPVTELKNHYSSQYGSGLVVAQSLP